MKKVFFGVSAGVASTGIAPYFGYDVRESKMYFTLANTVVGFLRTLDPETVMIFTIFQSYAHTKSLKKGLKSREFEAFQNRCHSKLG